LLDLRPLMSGSGYDGSNPLADGAISVSAANGGVVVSVDPANTGTMAQLVTLVGVSPNDVITNLLWQ
jgi:hypothetical protein